MIEAGATPVLDRAPRARRAGGDIGYELVLWPEAIGLAPSQAPAARPAGDRLLATGVVPFPRDGARPIRVATVLEVAPPRVIFAGFASSAPWLLFGGLVTGNAVQGRGLGRRLARLLAISAAPTDGSGTARSRRASLRPFLMPAALGRIIILVPILVVAAESSFGRHGPGRRVELRASSFGTILPACAIRPANLPNMVLLGVPETLYGVSPSYAAYLLLHFPVLGLLDAIVPAGLICWSFPDRPARDRTAPIRCRLGAPRKGRSACMTSGLASAIGARVLD